jgi:hypothetical protein
MFVCFLLFLSLLQIRCGEQAQTGAVSICEGNQIKSNQLLLEIKNLATKKPMQTKYRGVVQMEQGAAAGHTGQYQFIPAANLSIKISKSSIGMRRGATGQNTRLLLCEKFTFTGAFPLSVAIYLLGISTRDIRQTRQ